MLTHITRKQFDTAELHHAIAPHRVICGDEMPAHVEAEAFQSRLWDMFPTLMRGVLSLPQIDRVRWILFPEVRVNMQPELLPRGRDDDTCPTHAGEAPQGNSHAACDAPRDPGGPVGREIWLPFRSAGQGITG